MPKQKKKKSLFSKRFEKLTKKFKTSFKPKTQKMIKGVGIGALTIALTVMVYFGEQAGMWFKASVLEAPQPFNGTVMPVSKVPNWVHWGGDASTHYDSISPEHLIDLPKYDLAVMAFPSDDLVWGNKDHDFIRNTKITYSVVYMGNYKFDHKENVGSHLAIDLKLPTGTPLHSIANGKIVKTSMQSNGFGHHVVIKHPNVPDPVNPGRLTTLYSGYSHMSDISVVEGQNVLKGEVIGKSGNSGTSTAPHLHFQIDRETAPWHPYWPFTWSEAQGAGLSFFEAVNAGLGMERGRENTVHPMGFITSNISAFSVASTDPNSGIENPSNESDTEPGDPIEDPIENPNDKDEPEIEVIEDPSPEPGISLFEFEISGETVSLTGNGVTLVVEDKKNQTGSLNDQDEIEVELTGVGNLVTKRLTKSDFSNSTAKVFLNSQEVGQANIQIGKSAFQVNFIDEVKGIEKFKVEHDGFYQNNVVETLQIIALDSDDNVTPNLNFSGDVQVKVTDGSASVTPESLRAVDFKNGIAEVQLVAKNSDPVTIRAQNGALVGDSSPIRVEEARVFTDITPNHKNYQAIKFLKEKDIISGYNDGSFKPNNTVNRVEALKMLMLAFSVNVGAVEPSSFTDTNSTAWYADTLNTAVSKGIVKGYDDGSFRPANTVNKAEYLKMLFVTNNIAENGTITSKPYEDVPTDAWFASYAFLVNKMNLIETTNNLLRPGAGMTRAEVAETIYRLKMVQENNWVAFVSN